MNPNWQHTTTIRWSLFGQLWLSGVTAVVSFYFLQRTLNLEEPLALIGLMTLVGLIPLFFNWQIIRTMTLMATGLHYLTQHHQLANLPASTYWPFHRLIEKINILSQEGRDVEKVRGAFVEQVREAAAQEERQRLARDLHDSIKQQIFGMNISAATAQARFTTDPDGALQAIARLQGRATDVMEEMDTLLQQLRPAPLEKMGLIQAIRQQCTSLGYRTGADVTVQVDELPPDDQFEIGAQEHLYRIVQEGLSNIARHARAHTVHVSLQVTNAEHLQLSISDDGQGFDTSQTLSGLGLSNIQDRADKLNAHLHVQTALGEGTTIQVSDIPVNQTTSVSNLITPEVIHAHLQSQKNRDSRFYTILIALFALLPLVWQILQALVSWFPVFTVEEVLNIPSLVVFLCLWSFFQSLESRQWLNTAQLDANLNAVTLLPLKQYVLGHHVAIIALLGYIVTYGIYWLGRFLPSVWLYERPLAITILLTSLLFAGGTAYFLWQWESVYQQLIQNTPREEPLINKTRGSILTFIFVTMNLLAWVSLTFFQNESSDLGQAGVSIVYMLTGLQLLGILLSGTIGSFYVVFRVGLTVPERFKQIFSVWGKAIERSKPLMIPLWLTTIFWTVNMSYGVVVTTQTSWTTNPIAFWVKCVTAGTLITIWFFTLIRCHNSYQISTEEVSHV